MKIAGALTCPPVPVALFIGTVGAASVFKAVYIDRREQMRVRGREQQRPARVRVADREPDDGRHGRLDDGAGDVSAAERRPTTGRSAGGSRHGPAAVTRIGVW